MCWFTQGRPRCFKNALSGGEERCYFLPQWRKAARPLLAAPAHGGGRAAPRGRGEGPAAGCCGRVAGERGVPVRACKTLGLEDRVQFSQHHRGFGDEGRASPTFLSLTVLVQLGAACRGWAARLPQEAGERGRSAILWLGVLAHPAIAEGALLAVPAPLLPYQTPRFPPPEPPLSSRLPLPLCPKAAPGWAGASCCGKKLRIVLPRVG